MLLHDPGIDAASLRLDSQCEPPNSSGCKKSLLPSPYPNDVGGSAVHAQGQRRSARVKAQPLPTARTGAVTLWGKALAAARRGPPDNI